MTAAFFYEPPCSHAPWVNINKSQRFQSPKTLYSYSDSKIIEHFKIYFLLLKYFLWLASYCPPLHDTLQPTALWVTLRYQAEIFRAKTSGIFSFLARFRGIFITLQPLHLHITINYGSQNHWEQFYRPLENMRLVSTLVSIVLWLSLTRSPQYQLTPQQ